MRAEAFKPSLAHSELLFTRVDVDGDLGGARVGAAGSRIHDLELHAALGGRFRGDLQLDISTAEKDGGLASLIRSTQLCIELVQYFGKTADNMLRGGSLEVGYERILAGHAAIEACGLIKLAFDGQQLRILLDARPLHVLKITRDNGRNHG